MPATVAERHIACAHIRSKQGLQTINEWRNNKQNEELIAGRLETYGRKMAGEERCRVFILSYGDT